MLDIKKLLNVPITVSPKEKILHELKLRLKSKKQTIIFTPNPEILVHSNSDGVLFDALNTSDINIPDGKGVGLFLGIPAIPGRSFILDILSTLDEINGSVFILTGDESSLKNSINKLSKDYPNIKSNGAVGPKLDMGGNPLDSKQSKVNDTIIKDIKKIRPTVVFVGFGAPKQEKWIRKYASYLQSVSFMGVGGSFDYYSGKKVLPPKTLETLGLEWLWRLIHEPGHISRVFRALIVFPILVVFKK